MESSVRIKATSHDMRDAFENNKVFSVRYYEPLENLPDNFDENELILFKALVRHRKIEKELQNRVYTIKGLEKAILNAPTEKPTITLLKVLNYTVPMYGNKRVLPYATLLIKDWNGVEKKVQTKEDYGRVYIKVGGFTYYVKNNGGLHYPNLTIE